MEIRLNDDKGLALCHPCRYQYPYQAAVCRFDLLIRLAPGSRLYHLGGERGVD